MDIFKQKLIDVTVETPTVRTFHFEAPENYTWVEGSHLHMAFSDYDLGQGRNPNKIRHMSIASLPQENNIAITTKLTLDSPFKQSMTELSPGDSMQLFDISSRLFLRRQNRPIILLSNGVGLAAFRPLILKFLSDPSRIPSLHSLTAARNGHEIYLNELCRLQSDSFTQSWFSQKAALREALEEYSGTGSLYYIVGSELFIRDSIRTLRKLGVPDEDMIIDKKPRVREMFFKTLDLISDSPFVFK